MDTKPTIIRYHTIDALNFLIVVAYGSSAAVQHYRRPSTLAHTGQLVEEHCGGTEWCLSKFGVMADLVG